VKIGEGFDATDWQNSLVKNVEEKPYHNNVAVGYKTQLTDNNKIMKKLTANDIPEGYNYAAVDSNGIAYAFKTIPIFNFVAGVWHYTDEEVSLLRIGEDFDATNWTTSLVDKKTLKKLTVEDIPEGYSWATVDSDGIAYAFTAIPILNRNAACWFPTNGGTPLFKIGEDFDATNWTTSLIEKKILKKLTVEDIPEGYSWAAIDKFGWAFAFKSQPYIWNDFTWGENGQDTAIKIGSNFDVSNWKNSLINKPTKKKLTVKDIPEGYDYAAVDQNGVARAHAEKPFIDPVSGCWNNFSYNMFIEKDYDSTDWKRSLVTREENEAENNRQAPIQTSIKFEFTQEGNCLNGGDEIITIEATSHSGIDKAEDIFYVLKTDSWSFDNVKELSKLIEKVEEIMKNK
jgi:translation elongation factor EF-1beta